MLAEKLLREGDLDQALTELQNAVRDDPASSRFRVFLFQLLCVRGDWDRALTQLNVLKDMDAGTLPMVQTYREAIQCEALRDAVFSGKRSPLIFGEPEEWIARMLEAVKASLEGNAAGASELRNKALEAAPASAGEITLGEEEPVPFEWISDADSRMGPMLEVVMQGKYYWVPFKRVIRIDFDPPEDLRDFVWTPAKFKWTNGGEEVGLVPTRYPGSQATDDAAVKLSKKTDWVDAGEGNVHGLGQRLLATDVDDYPILEIRTLQFAQSMDFSEPVAEEGEQESEDGPSA